MIGEPLLIMLIEDNIDHAELVIRTLENHLIPNRVRHFQDGQSALDYLFIKGNSLGLQIRNAPISFCWT